MRSADGQPATVSELFDPSVNAFLPIAMVGGEPRSSQTATLLTDGRVLVAGGSGVDGRPSAAAALWDSTQNVATVSVRRTPS